MNSQYHISAKNAIEGQGVVEIWGSWVERGKGLGLARSGMKMGRDEKRLGNREKAALKDDG
jgi:hypothetical protein